jgi:hypothetical protein
MEYTITLVLDDDALVHLKATGHIALTSAAFAVAPSKRVSNELLIDFFWRALSVRDVARLTGLAKVTITKRWKKLGLPTGYYPKDRYRFREAWETREVG